MRYLFLLAVVAILTGCAVTTSEQPYDGAYIRGYARTAQPDEIIVYY